MVARIRAHQEKFIARAERRERHARRARRRSTCPQTGTVKDGHEVNGIPARRIVRQEYLIVPGTGRGTGSQVGDRPRNVHRLPRQSGRGCSDIADSQIRVGGERRVADQHRHVVALARAGGVVFKDRAGAVARHGELELARTARPVWQQEGITPASRLPARNRPVRRDGRVVIQRRVHQRLRCRPVAHDQMIVERRFHRAIAAVRGGPRHGNVRAGLEHQGRHCEIGHAQIGIRRERGGARRDAQVVVLSRAGWIELRHRVVNIGADKKGQSARAARTVRQAEGKLARAALPVADRATGVGIVIDDRFHQLHACREVAHDQAVAPRTAGRADAGVRVVPANHDLCAGDQRGGRDLQSGHFEVRGVDLDGHGGHVVRLDGFQLVRRSIRDDQEIIQPDVIRRNRHIAGSRVSGACRQRREGRRRFGDEQRIGAVVGCIGGNINAVHPIRSRAARPEVRNCPGHRDRSAGRARGRHDQVADHQIRESDGDRERGRAVVGFKTKFINGVRRIRNHEQVKISTQIVWQRHRGVRGVSRVDGEHPAVLNRGECAIIAVACARIGGHHHAILPGAHWRGGGSIGGVAHRPVHHDGFTNRRSSRRAERIHFQVSELFADRDGNGSIDHRPADLRVARIHRQARQIERGPGGNDEGVHVKRFRPRNIVRAIDQSDGHAASQLQRAVGEVVGVAGRNVAQIPAHDFQLGRSPRIKQHSALSRPLI